MLMISLLVIIYVVFISLGLPDSVFGVSWPVIHIDFGIAESFASLYAIITGFCSGGAGFLAGVVIRKFGTPRVTFASILLTAAGLIGISFSPNIWVMIAFTVILGYGAGAIDTGLNNYVSLHYKARHMSWLHCFWGVGVTISPIIMSFFLKGENSSWRTGYRVIATIQIVIALAVLCFLKKWRENDSAIFEANQHEESAEKPKIFKIKGVWPSILSLGFYCSMEFTIGTWGASYLVNVYSHGADAAARWIAFYFGGIMLGRLVSGFLSIKASDQQLIKGGAIAAFFGIIVLALPLGNVSFFGLMLIGFGFGPVFPSVIHSVPIRFGKEYSADITGFHMGGAYAVGFASQLAFGYLATATTFRIFPYALMVLIILMSAANLTANKRISSQREMLS